LASSGTKWIASQSSRAQIAGRIGLAILVRADATAKLDRLDLELHPGPLHGLGHRGQNRVDRLLKGALFDLLKLTDANDDLRDLGEAFAFGDLTRGLEDALGQCPLVHCCALRLGCEWGRAENYAGD
jgi:hypothetical protein